ncbi:hypothetical protein Y032_0021g422 [Ancylostoma ceylanicum]|uniref:Uncharacterized protein n=1 Tax=Ancylostoma ceylanicum TaxID=53326 RepID=A0A016V215_9BILA|nr:hypothetical protein Y032_0021g422 [Ancylostoma ceylanicum]
MRKLCDWLTSYGKTRLNGVVVPRARFLAVRSMFFNDLMLFGKYCHWEARDLPNAQAAETMRTSGRRFLCATPEANYLQMFDEFEEAVISALRKIGLDGKVQSRAQLGLEIPDF